MTGRFIACLHSHGALFIAHRYAFAPVSFPFAAANAACFAARKSHKANVHRPWPCDSDTADRPLRPGRLPSTSERIAWERAGAARGLWLCCGGRPSPMGIGLPPRLAREPSALPPFRKFISAFALIRVHRESERNSDAAKRKLCELRATNLLRSRMSTQQLRTREASGPAEVLQKSSQIRCHLLCVRRQLSRFHFDRIPFHVHGILRAIEMVD